MTIDDFGCSARISRIRARFFERVRARHPKTMIARDDVERASAREDGVGRTDGADARGRARARALRRANDTSTTTVLGTITSMTEMRANVIAVTIALVMVALAASAGSATRMGTRSAASRLGEPAFEGEDASAEREMQSQSVFDDVKSLEDDDGLVTEDEARDFENRPWPWPTGISCDQHSDFVPAQASSARRDHWHNSMFALSYWRLPRTRNYQFFDVGQLRDGFCKAGEVQLNVVAVMDAEESCAYAKAHYNEGHIAWPKEGADLLGKGTFLCYVLKPRDFEHKLHKGCHAHNAVEINRVSNMVKTMDYLDAKVAAGTLEAYTHLYYVDPDSFDASLIATRLFSPTLAKAYPNAFRVPCRRDGSILRDNNCQIGVQKSPIRPFVSKIMGGSMSAVRTLHTALNEFLDEFVPLRREDGEEYHFTVDKTNGLLVNTLTKKSGCVCPSDEEILSEMAHDERYAALFATRGADESGKLRGATCGWVEWKSGLLSED